MHVEQGNKGTQRHSVHDGSVWKKEMKDTWKHEAIEATHLTRGTGRTRVCLMDGTAPVHYLVLSPKFHFSGSFAVAIITFGGHISYVVFHAVFLQWDHGTCSLVVGGDSGYGDLFNCCWVGKWVFVCSTVVLEVPSLGHSVLKCRSKWGSARCNFWPQEAALPPTGSSSLSTGSSPPFAEPEDSQCRLGLRQESSGGWDKGFRWPFFPLTLI